MDPRSLLIQELCELLLTKGFIIHGAAGDDRFAPPAPVPNGRFGNLQDILPDVEAFDPKEKRRLYGIVCLSAKEIDSEATSTRWNVFLNQPERKGEKSPLVMVMVPSGIINDLTAVITHALHPDYWGEIRLVASSRM